MCVFIIFIFYTELFIGESAEGTAHWIERAKYDGHEPEDIRAAIAVWKLFPILLTLPIFWTLFDQQASSWSTFIYYNTIISMHA